MEVFDASFNLISELSDLDQCSSIRRINLSHNRIHDEENFQPLVFLDSLEELDLSENPIQELNDFEELLKRSLPNPNVRLEFSNKSDGVAQTKKSLKEIKKGNKTLNLFP